MFINQQIRYSDYLRVSPKRTEFNFIRAILVAPCCRPLRSSGARRDVFHPAVNR